MKYMCFLKDVKIALKFASIYICIYIYVTKITVVITKVCLSFSIIVDESINMKPYVID